MNHHDPLFHALNTAGHDPARRRLDPAGAQLLREAAAALVEANSREAKLVSDAQTATKDTVRTVYILGVFGMALTAVLLALPVLLGFEPRDGGVGVTLRSTIIGILVLLALLGFQVRSILQANPAAGVAAASMVVQTTVGVSCWVTLTSMLSALGVPDHGGVWAWKVITAFIVTGLSVLVAIEAGGLAERFLAHGEESGAGTSTACDAFSPSSSSPSLSPDAPTTTATHPPASASSSPASSR